MNNDNAHDIPVEILDKLKKLLTFKDDAEKRGSLNEVENAAEKIQRILLEYNLSIETVKGHKLKDKAAVGEQHLDLNEMQTRHEADWATSLTTVISRHYMCTTIKWKMNRREYDQGKIAIVGKPHNIEIVKYTIFALISRIRIASREAYKVYDGPEKRNAYFRGFFRGAVMGISAKLHYEKERIFEEAEKKNREESSSQENGMSHPKMNPMMQMITTNNEALAKYIGETYGCLGRANPKKKLSAMNGFAQGYKTGQSMDIQDGLKGGNANQGRLPNS